MKAINKKQLIISCLVCLLPLALIFSLWDSLPDQLPIHFNMQGEADNYAPKAAAAFGLPAFMVFLNLIIYFAINADPKKKNVNGAIALISLWISPVLSLILVPLTLFKGLGYNIPINIVVPAFVGLIIIIIGNYLPKTRQSYTVGIKLPWTLNDEENWNKTHRFSGFVWVICGAVILISSFLGGGFFFLILPIILLLLLPLAYSYLLYKRKLRNKQ